MGYYNKDAVRMVVNFVLFIIVLFLLSIFIGCRSTRTLTSETRDSIRYETRYVQQIVYDTVDLYIPPIREEVLIPDSFSFLQNEFAVSEAEVRSGHLRHTLETKPSVKRVQVVKEVITKDTIIYKDREVQVERVTEKRLPLWKRALIYLAPILATLCLFLAIKLKLK